MNDLKRLDRLRKKFFYLVANKGGDKQINALAKQIKQLEIKLGVKNG
ncbi:MAG: hypothetical protein PHE50_02630 [Dehalococcoidales bacterium]|nr:hypothetical protein [Dehalococcoidales bacterium]